MGYFRKNIENMEGYQPGEQPQDGKYIKLNTNENPYPPSPKVAEAIKKEANISIRLYPSPMADSLRRKAAEVYGAKEENILAGNGADDLLSILVRSFVGKGDMVVIPTPTYTLYDTLVAIQEGKKLNVPFTEDFEIPEGFVKRGAKLTFLANPNSPSGTFTPVKKIAGIAKELEGVLVVDEAYVDFASESAIPLINEYPNIVVLHTFSKSFSLAGMRIGLAFANRNLIQGMAKIKDSYNLNRLSIAAATAALNDMPWMEKNVAKIKKTRGELSTSLAELGFKVYPSQSNFVLAKISGRNLKGIYEKLKRRGILLRYFDTPKLQDCLRITVGTDDEIARLLEELSEILEKK
ncbi:MAG: histidinol-phosphate transaminase [Thermodesulfobacteriota bacterium]